eukprot:m.258648 g.258648  ORF g.258648 m.258648 type:complete len:86 (-) comp16193_c0_seq27:740-997(-)
MHCPVHTLFQQNPLITIPYYNKGVTFFVTKKPNTYLTRLPSSLGLIRSVFGVCGAGDIASPKTWIGWCAKCEYFHSLIACIIRAC